MRLASWPCRGSVCGCTQRHISFSTTLASHPPLYVQMFHPYTHPPPSFNRANSKRVLFSRLAPLTTRWQLLLLSRSVMKQTGTPLEIPASGPSTQARINFLKNSLLRRKPEWAATRRPRGTQCSVCVCMWRPGSTSSLLWVWWSLAWTRLLYSELKFTLLA